MGTPEAWIDLEPLVKEYREGVDRELVTRLEAWPPDFAHIQVHEVIGGMLARQATLAKEIASAPVLWNGHSAPILLRAMADVYINIAWLLLAPAVRCLKFISFGLGQAKLELEHRRAEIGDREPTAEEVAIIEACERWIDTQRAHFLQDVDLGKWAALSVRQMADEAGCLDFYNFVYTPFSACAHSMWHHIGHYNLIKCTNPLHRYHRWPVSSAADPDIHYMLLAAKYWAKTLGTFDGKTGTHVVCPSTYNALITAISAEDTPEAENA
jgi:Family of unknown function (DUF5677)